MNAKTVRNKTWRSVKVRIVRVRVSCAYVGMIRTAYTCILATSYLGSSCSYYPFSTSHPMHMNVLRDQPIWPPNPRDLQNSSTFSIRYPRLRSCFISLFSIPCTLDVATCKEIAPLVYMSLSPSLLRCAVWDMLMLCFYQVAWGLILPFTVFLSYFFLEYWPSLWVLILWHCQYWIFIGVLLNNYITSPSTSQPSGLTSMFAFTNSLGLIFGCLSTITTVPSAVIIKQQFSLFLVCGYSRTSDVCLQPTIGSCIWCVFSWATLHLFNYNNNDEINILHMG